MRIRRPWPCGLSFSDGSSGHSMVFARQCVTSIAWHGFYFLSLFYK